MKTSNMFILLTWQIQRANLMGCAKQLTLSCLPVLWAEPPRESQIQQACKKIGCSALLNFATKETRSIGLLVRATFVESRSGPDHCRCIWLLAHLQDPPRQFLSDLLQLAFHQSWNWTANWRRDFLPDILFRFGNLLTWNGFTSPSDDWGL